MGKGRERQEAGDRQGPFGPSPCPTTQARTSVPSPLHQDLSSWPYQPHVAEMGGGEVGAKSRLGSWDMGSTPSQKACKGIPGLRGAESVGWDAGVSSLPALMGLGKQEGVLGFRACHIPV